MPELYVLMTIAGGLIGSFSPLVRALMVYMIPDGYSATIMSFEGNVVVFLESLSSV